MSMPPFVVPRGQRTRHHSKLGHVVELSFTRQGGTHTSNGRKPSENKSNGDERGMT